MWTDVINYFYIRLRLKSNWELNINDDSGQAAMRIYKKSKTEKKLQSTSNLIR